MKKKKLKLSLNKMTVAKINDPSIVKGGASNPCGPTPTRGFKTCAEAACVTNTLCEVTGPALC